MQCNNNRPLFFAPNLITRQQQKNNTNRQITRFTAFFSTLLYIIVKTWDPSSYIFLYKSIRLTHSQGLDNMLFSR